MKGRPGRMRIRKRRDPAEVMGHACIDYGWRDSRDKGDYEYLPDFLEC